ncbi:extensin-like [Drosophila rhopaloa]|uniref:Uncharacterized protein n=1 Tax=Drosophila rhopaloa TaxID=1041015 RepID=A0ABM5JD14_DRORH|nr:extensin-like [Drosophila rhopaloa]
MVSSILHLLLSPLLCVLSTNSTRCGVPYPLRISSPVDGSRVPPYPESALRHDSLGPVDDSNALQHPSPVDGSRVPPYPESALRHDSPGPVDDSNALQHPSPVDGSRVPPYPESALRHDSPGPVDDSNALQHPVYAPQNAFLDPSLMIESYFAVVLVPVPVHPPKVELLRPCFFVTAFGRHPVDFSPVDGSRVPPYPESALRHDSLGPVDDSNALQHPSPVDGSRVPPYPESALRHDSPGPVDDSNALQHPSPVDGSRVPPYPESALRHDSPGPVDDSNALQHPVYAPQNAFLG